jgi:hypothetical protein
MPAVPSPALPRQAMPSRAEPATCRREGSHNLCLVSQAATGRRGYSEIRLYANVLMTENRRLYAAIGYEKTGRGIDAGFERVFMCKRLSGPSTDTVLPVQKQLEAYNAREPRSRSPVSFPSITLYNATGKI